MSSETVLRRSTAAIFWGCTALLGFSLLALTVPPVRRWLSASGPPGYALGQKVDLVSSAYDGQTRTVLVFGRDTCGACVAAEPFLRDLVARLGNFPTAGIRLVTPLPMSSAGREYAQAAGFEPNKIVTVDFKRLRVRELPTFVVVNRAGTIEWLHEGSPIQLDEPVLVRSILEAIGR